MSTDDDFATILRARLHDLADREDGWDDPVPTAREIAAAGIAPDDDPAIVSLAVERARGRRWLPMLAVAAVVLAFVAGGGLGLRELTRSGGGSASSAAMAASDGSPEDAAAGAAPSTDVGSAAPGGGPVTGSSGSGLSCPAGPGSDCADLASCADLGPATSTGPLAGNGSIRPGGIIGPRVAAGGTVDVPYVLSFAAAGPTADVRAAQVYLVTDGHLVGTSGDLGSDLIEPLTVAPGVAASGSVTFHATDCEGQPLPAGEYQVVVAYAYTVDGSTGSSMLVSAPLLAVVS